MELVFRIIVICFIGALLALVLKKETPEMGLLLTLTVLLLIFSLLMQPIREIFLFLDQLGEIGGLSSVLLVPMYKASGIAMVVRIGSCICRDAGESALASGIEMAGTVCTFLVAMPLFRAVLEMLVELMK